jgi:iron complex outermembrane recepter protein
VINISTMPNLAEPRLEAQALVGGFGLQRYDARASTPVGGGELWGSFVQSEFDGWRQNSNSRRSLLTVVAASEIRPDTRISIVGLGSINEFHIPGPLTIAQVAANPQQANPRYMSRSERRFNRIARIGLILDHGLDDPVSVSGLMFVSPKALQRSERGTFRDFTRYHVGGNIVGRARFRYNSSLEGLILAGVDEAYQDGAILFYNLTAAGGRGDTLRDDKREGANNLGGFLQHDLVMGKRVTLSLGARFDAIRYFYDSHIRPRLDATKAFTHLTPKVALNFRATPRQSLYVSVGGGVEAPAGNETDPASTFGQDTITAINPLLEAITSTTYEGGEQALLRSENGLIQDLRFDLAIYHTRVTNEIVPYRGGQFYFTAGKAQRSGAELGIHSSLAGGFTAAAATTYSINRYSKYIVDSVHYGRPGQTADYSGNQIVGVPRFILGSEVAFEPNSHRVRLQLNLESNSGFFADDANGITVPGYLITSATAGFPRPIAITRGLAVSGFVSIRNILNRHYISSAYLNPDVVSGVPVAFEPGLPRQLLISLSLTRSLEPLMGGLHNPGRLAQSLVTVQLALVDSNHH